MAYDSRCNLPQRESLGRCARFCGSRCKAAPFEPGDPEPDADHGSRCKRSQRRAWGDWGARFGGSWRRPFRRCLARRVERGSSRKRRARALSPRPACEPRRGTSDRVAPAACRTRAARDSSRTRRGPWQTALSWARAAVGSRGRTRSRPRRLPQEHAGAGGTWCTPAPAFCRAWRALSERRYGSPRMSRAAALHPGGRCGSPRTRCRRAQSLRV